MTARIPLHEFRERAARLQTLMGEQDLDIILAYGNEAEPQYLRYFSDYWPSFETGAALIPASGDLSICNIGQPGGRYHK